ncbi:hypothetical protein NUW54_g2316 [Trametes sanguinea]|uniref:Uncharacterized protein n=2 Tax=Trametes sanguinea TaxID=158606 RepID=A0ACC1Q583_9APHY|nr:hypothetical protein NUW54_g3091 [Trametes sanguinea]KAJ3010990.1 hypothetical protein NUW54_g2316 [Trametes sanguinea]
MCLGRVPDCSPPIPLQVILQLLQYVDVGTLMTAIRPASRAYASLVSIELRGRQKRLIHQFVHDTSQFIARILRDCHVVIGGSAALQYICPSTPPPTDYDLYVPSKHANDVLEYLLIVEGYEVELDTTICTPTPRHASALLYNAVEYTAGTARIVTLWRGETKVDIIEEILALTIA